MEKREKKMRLMMEMMMKRMKLMVMRFREER